MLDRFLSTVEPKVRQRNGTPGEHAGHTEVTEERNRTKGTIQECRLDTCNELGLIFEWG